MPEVLRRVLPSLLVAASCVFPAGVSAIAADAGQGKTIAERWCSGCHLVTHEQKNAPTDQAPTFASLAARPDFGAGKLALLILAPHPNMPKLALSRSEIADLADYILTLK